MASGEGRGRGVADVAKLTGADRMRICRPCRGPAVHQASEMSPASEPHLRLGWAATPGLMKYLCVEARISPTGTELTVRDSKGMAAAGSAGSAPRTPTRVTPQQSFEGSSQIGGRPGQTNGSR